MACEIALRLGADDNRLFDNATALAVVVAPWRSFSQCRGGQWSQVWKACRCRCSRLYHKDDVDHRGKKRFF